MLGRVESPGFQHTAVMLGCVEPSEVNLLPTIIEILHTLVDIYQSGPLLLVRVESPISQHTAVLLGGVESRCPRRLLWTGV